MITGGEFPASPEMSQPVPFVIHGSFGKHLDEIGRAAELLTSSGLAVVLAPHDCETAGQEDGFVLLTGEEGQDPRDIEAAYLEQVLSLRSQGGASIFVNPSGYVGKSAAYEAGIVHASGGRIFWTEQPNDVPFYVNPASIMPVDTLISYMQEHQGALPPPPEPSEPISQRWHSLPFPVAHIAEGAIMRHDNRLLLVEDGRWAGNRLTIPGTRVRAGEHRTEALGRLANTKIGVEIEDVYHFATNFMIAGSGYRGPVDPDALVFEDHVVDVRSSRREPQNGLRTAWLSPAEVASHIDNGTVEPNAARVLTNYLQTAA